MNDEGTATAPAWGPVTAPAKLTVSLRVTGVRADGYHEIDSEMVTLDLVDTLVFAEGDGLVVERQGDLVADPAWPGDVEEIPAGADNLVSRALVAARCRAAVRLVKRIPAGAGLGGGSADAAAVLRWAGCSDVAVAARLGADVPFCVVGGRARVAGIGEQVGPLPFVARSYTLLLPPFGVQTPAVYRMWDELDARGALPPSGTVANELEAPALAVEPRLAEWRDAFAKATGEQPRMAGSGSTWFVEGSPAELGLADRGTLALGPLSARLVGVRTTPA